MRETKLYQKIRPHLLVWGECDRVENAAGSGMSDVFYNIGGVCGWIETKVAKGSLIYFEKFQLPWIGKHHRIGGRIFIVVMDKDETIHVYPAGIVLKAERRSIEKWTVIDMNEMPPVFNMHAPYRSWGMVRDILTN